MGKKYTRARERAPRNSSARPASADEGRAEARGRHQTYRKMHKHNAGTSKAPALDAGDRNGTRAHRSVKLHRHVGASRSPSIFPPAVITARGEKSTVQDAVHDTRARSAVRTGPPGVRSGTVN